MAKTKKTIKKSKQPITLRAILKRSGLAIKNFGARIVRRPLALRKRRAHKSFRLTRRRDIPKAPPLPGYVSFTFGVWNTLWRFKKIFGIVLGLYIVTSIVIIGIAQQDEYRAVIDAFSGAEEEAGADPFGPTTRALGVFGATFFGTLSGSLSEVQQLYLVSTYIVMWLVVVWLLRHLIADNAVRVRDALYGACAPLISTLCVAGLMLVQSLPGALGVYVFTIAVSSGALGDGVPAMLFGVAAVLLILLSLYLLASSFFALIIVTLPGTYPMTAIRGASDIALGRRLPLLLRLIWLVIIVAIIWIVVVLPVLLVDMWLGLSWIPIVTIAVQAATGLSLIFGFSYIFLLYRRMIDDSTE